jgi:DNA (cytosine-5)-methyltransferase 1
MQRKQQARLGVVELFAGAGGLALGFQDEGSFDLIALSDIEASARNTFKHNHAGVRYIREDVRNVSVDDLHDAADGRIIHGLLGGPPCQGFSLAGRKDPNDERNAFITEYVRFVHSLKPYFLLMENVPQVLYHRRFRDLLGELSQEYTVTYSVLNAARYGVPQTRHRTFVLAFRRDIELTPTFPRPTHGFVERPTFNYHARRIEQPTAEEAVISEILGADPVISCYLQRFVTPPDGISAVAPLLPLTNVWDKISDLAVNVSSEFARNRGDEDLSLSECGKIFNHVHRRHDERMHRLMNIIGEGDDLRCVEDKSLLPKSHYSQAYGRLHRQGLSRTITTYFCNPGSGRFLHPTLNRSLTVREAARLQSFPDSYAFLGTQSEQMRLVGNAVPPTLAKAIARHIAQTLRPIIANANPQTTTP